MHRSPYFGQSVEFLQHREYTPGDDLRHIDWKVWAKQDRLLRQAVRGRHQPALHAAGRCLEQHAIRPRADEQVRICLHGRGEPGVFAVAAAGRRGLRGVRREQCGPRCRCGTKRSHLNSIIQSLSVSRPRKKTDLQQILRNAAEKFPRRGMMILISDLLWSGPACSRGSNCCGSAATT